MLELAQPQLQKWARCSTAVFTLNVYVQREAATASSCSRGLQCHAPSRWELPLHLMLPLYITKLTGGEGGWCVSIQALSLPGHSFMHVWSSVCCLFLHVSSPSVRFIGQAHVGHESWSPNRDLRVRWGLDENYGRTWSLRWGDTHWETHM
jgi:hypothetical protein